MNDRVLAIMVTYNPEIDVLVNNLSKLLNERDRVFISDNGSSNFVEVKTTIKQRGWESRVILKHMSENVGIATAQNLGLTFALENQFKFVCFFDQDTLVPDNFVNNMVSEFEIAKALHPSIGMLAPNFYDYRLKEYTHFAKLTRHSYCDVTSHKDTYEQVSFVVSSGSLVPVEVVKHVGLLVDELFIDQVDTEYSLRLLSNGYEIVVTPNVVLKHTIGERTKHQLLGLTIKPNHHSALRKYFVFRNGRYVVKLYQNKFPGIRVLMFKRFVHDFLGVVFFETHKIQKLKAMVLGLYDGAKQPNNWKRRQFK